jgi:hypothetical protein
VLVAAAAASVLTLQLIDMTLTARQSAAFVEMYRVSLADY